MVRLLVPAVLLTIVMAAQEEAVMVRDFVDDLQSYFKFIVFAALFS